MADRPLLDQDALVVAAMRAMLAPLKGSIPSPADRTVFDTRRLALAHAEGVRVENGEVGGVPGVWCRPADAVPGTRLLFLHGGGYVMGTARSTAPFAGQLAARTRADTFVADYRLAPEHPFPAAFDDAVAAYRGLVAESGGPVAVAGESAGGGLALALLPRTARASGLPPPCAAAVMSPMTDLTFSGESYRNRAEADPLITVQAMSEFAALYLEGRDPTDPRASPLLGDFAGLPPVRLDVGGDEVLLDDARLYAERARTAGADITLAVWLGLPHVFQAQYGRLAAAEASLDEMGAFLSAHLRGSG